MVDKKIMPFDLYDCFIRSLYHFKTNNIKIITIGAHERGYGGNPNTIVNSYDFVCNECKRMKHLKAPHKLMRTINGEPTRINCECSDCIS